MLAVLLAVVGLIEDLFGGLSFTRSAGTWPYWLGGLILTGILYAVAEMGFDWITDADRITDPLATRVLRLVLGMSFVALLLAAILLVSGFLQ